MSQLTAQDVYEAYLNAKSEGFDPFPGCVYAELFKDQKRRYERMAQLLNEKMTLPTAWVATGKIGLTTPFTVILATSSSGESDAIEQALDAIYESSLDDDTKDNLQNTLSVRKEN